MMQKLSISKQAALCILGHLNYTFGQPFPSWGQAQVAGKVNTRNFQHLNKQIATVLNYNMIDLLDESRFQHFLCLHYISVVNSGCSFSVVFFLPPPS
jgi:hypothetical protein